MLERQERRSWHDIVTLDESWFYLHTDHELIWAQPDPKIPERERHTLQSQKVMLTIVWNPGGFRSINILPKGFRFNASDSVTQILDPLSKWRRAQVGRTNRKLIMHADNARPHTAKMTSQFMEQNSMHREPHPAYSPDLAPSDFYLFGYVKQLLSGCQFADQESLLQAVRDILMGIEKVNLESVFHNWMERMCQCSATVESTWSKKLLTSIELRIT
jgi:histone-lysine N-methyltransferase SETMAR